MRFTVLAGFYPILQKAVPLGLLKNINPILSAWCPVNFQLKIKLRLFIEDFK